MWTEFVWLMIGTLNMVQQSAILQSSLYWTFFCIRESASCSEVNLYKADVISFYATWNGSNCVQFHVVSVHNPHYCGAFTELHWFLELRTKWDDPCTAGRDQWCNRGREERANDIAINWSLGRFYAVECLPSLVGIKNCQSLNKSVLGK
jgi:hypothetical protein